MSGRMLYNSSDLLFLIVIISTRAHTVEKLCANFISLCAVTDWEVHIRVVKEHIHTKTTYVHTSCGQHAYENDGK